MDKQLTVASKSKKAPRQAKSKKSKRPLKVVYISNPVWFQTSAAEFRGLVQQVTGQDSDIDNMPKFAETSGWKPEHRGESQFGLFDDGFDVHAMMENWSGFAPSTMSYEAPLPPQIGAFHGVDMV